LIHKLLKETVNLTKEGLTRDGRVNISGLSHFNLKWHEARQGRNPLTGETIEISARNKVTFKSEVSLRNFINRKYKHLKPIFIDNETEVNGTYTDAEHGSDIAIATYSQVVPADEKIQLDLKSKSNKIAVRFWYIVPLFIIAVIFLLWSVKDRLEPTVNGINIISEKSVKEVPILAAEPSQPIEKSVSEKVGIHNLPHRIK
jgi:nucleoid DNA-binding protein